MDIIGPFEREISVTIPVGDSRITVRDYKNQAEELIEQFAGENGYNIITIETVHNPAERLIVSSAIVEVYDFFEEIEPEDESWF